MRNTYVGHPEKKIVYASVYMNPLNFHWLNRKWMVTCVSHWWFPILYFWSSPIPSISNRRIFWEVDRFPFLCASVSALNAGFIEEHSEVQSHSNLIRVQKRATVLNNSFGEYLERVPQSIECVHYQTDANEKNDVFFIYHLHQYEFSFALCECVLGRL